MTTQPSNESELQLYRVLQRANLLAYYDTFICQGIYKNSHHCKCNKKISYQVVMMSTNYVKLVKKNF